MSDVRQRETRHLARADGARGVKGGERAFDIYSMLLRQRIIFLGQEVDDQIANLIISQMLYLEAQDADRDINLYINSPGGLAYAAWRSTTSSNTYARTCRRSVSGWGCRRRHGPVRRCTGKALGVTQRAHHDPPRQRRSARRTE